MAKIEGSKKQIIREAILSHPAGKFTVPEILSEVKRAIPGTIKQDIYLVTSELKHKGILERTKQGKEDALFKVVARPATAKSATAAAVRKLPENKPVYPIESMPIIKTEPSPIVKQEDLIDWGEALFSYAESLKETIRKMGGQISDEQQKLKDADIRHHQILTEKDKTIQELKDQIATLNRRVVEKNREVHQAGFKMEEIARFKK